MLLVVILLIMLEWEFTCLLQTLTIWSTMLFQNVVVLQLKWSIQVTIDYIITASMKVFMGYIRESVVTLTSVVISYVTILNTVLDYIKIMMMSS